LRLANAPVLPLDYVTYAARVGGFIDDLATVPGVKEHLDLKALRAAQQRWLANAKALEPVLVRALAKGGPNADKLNVGVRGLEQQWLLADGLPGRPWFKHSLYAPKYTYAALEFPGVREAVDKGDWPLAKQQLALLTDRMNAVAKSIATLTAGN